MYIDTELVLLICKAHPYFSLKNLGKKVHVVHCRTRSFLSFWGTWLEGPCGE